MAEFAASLDRINAWPTASRIRMGLQTEEATRPRSDRSRTLNL